MTAAEAGVEATLFESLDIDECERVNESSWSYIGASSDTQYQPAVSVATTESGTWERLNYLHSVSFPESVTHDQRRRRAVIAPYAGALTRVEATRGDVNSLTREVDKLQEMYLQDEDMWLHDARIGIKQKSEAMTPGKISALGTLAGFRLGINEQGLVIPTPAFRAKSGQLVHKPQDTVLAGVYVRKPE